MNHELIIEGKLTARCSCGQWQYVGVLAEAKKAIKELYEYHSKFDCNYKQTKKKK